MRSSERSLHRIERKLDLVLALLIQVLRQEGRHDMATQETLDKLTASVAENTDATAAAALALTGFIQTTADLTAALKAAMDKAGVDDPTVLAAVAAIDSNNGALRAAVPAVAAAVTDNTPAA
jgi:hypothetical protein